MLSVIIPTLNRAPLLHKALLSIREQTLSRDAFEVVVVDNGSNDDTPAVCDEARPWFGRFLYSRASKPGLHVARHRGLKLARGEFLVYADDDIQAERGWLAAIANAFNQADVALVGGKCLPDYEAQPPEWDRELWVAVPGGKFNVCHSLVDLGQYPKDIPAQYVFGCNFSIRKSALTRAGGFHPDGMPKALLHLRGDGETAVSEAITNMGYKTRYEPDAAVCHLVSRGRMTLDYVSERAFGQGVSDSYALLRKTGKFGMQTRVRSAVHTLKQWPLFGRVIGRSPCRRAFFRGYHAGFAWHQRRANRDRALQAWIVKETYLDDAPADE